MGTFSDAVEVVMTTAGVPLHLSWHGRAYTLAAEPVRWYERRSWWEEEDRAAPGTGTGLVDRQIWRVQVHRDGAGPGAPLLTLDLVRYLPGGHWRILKVHDALAEVEADAEDDGGTTVPADSGEAGVVRVRGTASGAGDITAGVLGAGFGRRHGA